MESEGRDISLLLKPALQWPPILDYPIGIIFIPCRRRAVDFFQALKWHKLETFIHCFAAHDLKILAINSGMLLEILCQRGHLCMIFLANYRVHVDAQPRPELPF